MFPRKQTFSSFISHVDHVIDFSVPRYLLVVHSKKILAYLWADPLLCEEQHTGNPLLHWGMLRLVCQQFLRVMEQSQYEIYFSPINLNNTGLCFFMHGPLKISFFKLLSQVSNESGLPSPSFIFVKRNQWIVLTNDFSKTLLLTLIFQITKLWAC